MHTILCITSYAFSSVVVSVHFGHYSSLVAHNMVSLLQTSNWQRWIHHAPVCTSEGPVCHWRASWKPTACAVCNKSNIISTACLQQASVYFTAGTWTLLFCYILSYYAFSSVQTIHFAHYLLLLDDGMHSLIHSYSWPQRLHSALLRISRRTTLQVKSKWTPIIQCATGYAPLWKALQQYWCEAKQDQDTIWVYEPKSSHTKIQRPVPLKHEQ